VDAKLGTYQTLVPSALENAAWWGSYDFLDSAGTPGRLEVGRLSDWQYGPLNWGDGTLSGNSATYGVLATVRNRASGNNVRAAVRQEVQIAAIPLSAFFLFSQLDLELSPGSGDWLVNGPVHGNANIYCSPGVAVTFQNFVTAAGEILHQRAPGDPLPPGGGSVTYARKEAKAGSVRVPFAGLPSNPTNLWAYCISQADLRIEVLTLTNLVAYNASNFAVPDTNVWAFVRTTNFPPPHAPIGFRDKREHDDGETTFATEFDVAKFTSRLNDLKAYMVGGKEPATVYIADRRIPDASATYMYMSIKLVHGSVLPPGGLTLATPNPLYVQGNFNAPTLGTTNGARRACLIADAVTVLSDLWDDDKSGQGLNIRPAVDTTVNASVVTGIVPTGAGNYSGGMENSLRLLEKWSGHQLCFNGSLAVLFVSQFAVGEWGRPDVYAPPNRVFRFAPCVGGSPLLTSPEARQLQTLFRSGWRAAQPGSAL
jgi:hypothetical protein